MLFSETLASIQPQDKGWSAVVGEDWSQGRATFGGMVAALGNEAMRRLVPAERKLRGLETVFAGPALTGALRMEAEVLRVGKAVTIAGARLWSADKIAATLTGTYGAARSTSQFRCCRPLQAGRAGGAKICRNHRCTPRVVPRLRSTSICAGPKARGLSAVRARTN